MSNYILSVISVYLILAYVIILFGERLQSLIRSFCHGRKNIFENGFKIYVNCTAILSLISALIVLFIFNGDFLRVIFSPSASNMESLDFRMICILIGVILVAGMVHTDYTINVLQFVSYGLLIVALILFTIMNQARSDSILLLWISLVYLVCLSMAIPVVYESKIKLHVIFHILEAVVSLALVATFSYLSYLVFIGEGTNLFLWIPILIAFIGDLLILILRWKEEINYFVLIFLIASVVTWIAGKIIYLILSMGL